AVSHPATLAALRLTGLVLGIVVPLHAVLGFVAAYAITRFEFPGKSVLVTLIDLPFAISPVVSGLLFVFLFGVRGLFGPFLLEHGVRVVYAVPGVVIATMFVTLPVVVRELVPLLDAQGREEEEAAATLGAGTLAIMLRVMLPRVRWGLLYGCVLCAARAAG